MRRQLQVIIIIIIITIIVADNKSLQQELTSLLTIMQLDKIVKIEKRNNVTTSHKI